MRTHDERVLSYLQGWLVGPLQAHRLLFPVLSSFATPGLLATLRAIGQAVSWNLAAIRGLVPLNLWLLLGLADEVGWEVLSRQGERPVSPEPTVERQAWEPDREWVLKQDIWFQTASVLSNLGVTFSQTPDRERTPALGGTPPVVQHTFDQLQAKRIQKVGGSIAEPDTGEKLRDAPQQEKAGARTRRDPGAAETARQKAPVSRSPGAHPSATRLDPAPAPLLVQSAARQGREASRSVEPVAAQATAVFARTDPRHPAWRLSSDLKLKEIIRSQVNVLLTGITMPSGVVLGQRGAIAEEAFAQSVFIPRVRLEAGWARTAEVRAGGPGEPDHGWAAPVRSKSEASYAPLAGADVAPTTQTLAPHVQEREETAPAAGMEPATLRVPGDARTAARRGTVRRVPPEKPVTDVTRTPSVLRRLFSAQKRPDSKEATAGPAPREGVLPRLSHAAASLEPSASEAHRAPGPGRDSTRPDRASTPPSSGRVTLSYEPRVETGATPWAASVQDEPAAEITRQVEATLAQVGAGLASLGPEIWPAAATADGAQRREVARGTRVQATLGSRMWPAEPMVDGAQMREVARGATSPGSQAAPMAWEIERRVAAIAAQIETPAVRRAEQGARLRLSAREQREAPVSSPPEVVSVAVLVQLLELVEKLQRQVQELAKATDLPTSSIPPPVEGLDSDGDPEALSRELAKQLVDEARRYGIRL